MSLTAEALATLRGPAPSREKYPDWQVARVERLPPSRKCKAELLGADGLREYSFFECVNGCGIDVKACEGGPSPVSALNDPEKLALVPALHKQGARRLSRPGFPGFARNLE